MPCRSDEEFAQGPDEPNAVKPPRRRINDGAGRDKSDVEISDENDEHEDEAIRRQRDNEVRDRDFMQLLDHPSHSAGALHCVSVLHSRVHIERVNHATQTELLSQRSSVSAARFSVRRLTPRRWRRRAAALRARPS
jgi:hypothetical protein